jgi:uroporphyrinogen-III synthase
MKTLFISRPVAQHGELATYCAQAGIQLIAESLIDFQSVTCSDFPTTDVVFFTSPRSVDFFLKQTILRPNQLAATVGEHTTKALENQGYKVHFTGSTPTQPKQVATEFARWLNGRSVLFPQSDRSNQTMQQALNSEQCVNRVVYQTLLLKKTIIPIPDVLIFSSPSNAEAFLLANEIHPYQRTLAFGTTTAAYLEKKGVTCEKLSGIREEELVDFIKNSL